MVRDTEFGHGRWRLDTSHELLHFSSGRSNIKKSSCADAGVTAVKGIIDRYYRARKSRSLSERKSSNMRGLSLMRAADGVNLQFQRPPKYSSHRNRLRIVEAERQAIHCAK